MLTINVPKSPRLSTVTATLLAVAVLSACATSHVMIGQARPAISPEQVRLYLRAPERHYEEIAALDTSSRGSFSFSAQAKTDAVIDRLKEEAARLGANGVLLRGVAEHNGGSISSGFAIYVEPIKIAAR